MTVNHEGLDHCQDSQPNYMKICPDCNKTFDEKKTRSKKCSSCKVKKSRQNTKLKAIAYKGGKCQVCDYNKSIRALTFHHRDPTKKDFGIADPKNRSFEAIKEELDKCDLLCMNCHMEEHERLDAK